MLSEKNLDRLKKLDALFFRLLAQNKIWSENYTTLLIERKFDEEFNKKIDEIFPGKRKELSLEAPFILQPDDKA